MCFQTQQGRRLIPAGTIGVIENWGGGLCEDELLTSKFNVPAACNKAGFKLVPHYRLLDLHLKVTARSLYYGRSRTFCTKSDGQITFSLTFSHSVDAPCKYIIHTYYTSMQYMHFCLCTLYFLSFGFSVPSTQMCCW